MTQSSRDVIDGLMRKKKVERVGLHDSPWHEAVQNWIKQGMPTNEKGEPVDCVDHFGFDMVGCGGWFDWVAIRRPEEILEQTDEWKVVRNGNGAVLKWWKNKSGTPEHIDFAMSSREVWERDYRPHLVKFDPGRVNVKETAEALARRRAQGLWTNYGHEFVWENMRGALGDFTLYTSLLTDPDWIHDICRVYTDLYKACFKILIEQAGSPDGIWLYEDLGYKHRLFASPQVLEELIFPYYAEIVDFFHGYDLPVVLHTCGLVEPALDLICAAGFDALNPIEVKAGNDPLRIADKYADRLAFIGGLDARILESGDRDLIRREVTNLVEGMKSRGASFVYASDHSISPNVTYQDFLYSIEVYREHMYY